MKTLIGGAVAAALGLLGIAIWWQEILTVLAGTIPIMLLLGGVLAIYLGFDELRETWKKDEAETYDTEPAPVAPEAVKEYESKIDELESKIEELESEKQKE